MNFFPVNGPGVSQSEISNRQTDDETSIKEACQEFEALLITQLLSNMRATSLKSDIFGEGKENEFFNEMLDQQMGSAIAHQEGIGLASVLYEQLTGKSLEEGHKIP